MLHQLIHDVQDVWKHLCCSYLTYRDLARLSQTCKSFQSVTKYAIHIDVMHSKIWDTWNEALPFQTTSSDVSQRRSSSSSSRPELHRIRSLTWTRSSAPLTWFPRNLPLLETLDLSRHKHTVYWSNPVCEEKETETSLPLHTLSIPQIHSSLLLYFQTLDALHTLHIHSTCSATLYLPRMPHLRVCSIRSNCQLLVSEVQPCLEQLTFGSCILAAKDVPEHQPLFPILHTADVGELHDWVYDSCPRLETLVYRIYTTQSRMEVSLDRGGLDLRRLCIHVQGVLTLLHLRNLCAEQVELHLPPCRMLLEECRWKSWNVSVHERQPGVWHTFPKQWSRWETCDWLDLSSSSSLRALPVPTVIQRHPLRRIRWNQYLFLSPSGVSVTTYLYTCLKDAQHKVAAVANLRLRDFFSVPSCPHSRRVTHLLLALQQTQDLLELMEKENAKQKMRMMERARTRIRDYKTALRILQESLPRLHTQWKEEQTMAHEDFVRLQTHGVQKLTHELHLVQSALESSQPVHMVCESFQTFWKSYTNIRHILWMRNTYQWKTTCGTYRRKCLELWKLVRIASRYPLLTLRESLCIESRRL